MANWIVENRITGEVASLDRLAAANLRADGINLRLAAAVGFLLGTAISSIFSFFLGTSRSSQSKDATIQTLAANK